MRIAFNSYKRDGDDKDKPEIVAMTVLEADAEKLAAVGEGVRAGQIVGEAGELGARPGQRAGELPDAHASWPVASASEAEAVGLKVDVLGEKQMAELGAGSFLGIAQGSDRRGPVYRSGAHSAGRRPREPCPRSCWLARRSPSTPAASASSRREGMWRMKDDMGGGAATAAALLAAASLNLPVHAVGLIPSTENMPAGNAIKPSDVVKAMNGKTVEIISTDAEGRQVLADALCYAARYNPTPSWISLRSPAAWWSPWGRRSQACSATTTICAAGCWLASELTGEALWPMPIWKPYRKLIDTDVADMKNSGGRWGGSIIAALFLREFAEGYPWAHLDIAGPVWQEENSPLPCTRRQRLRRAAAVRAAAHVRDR